MQTIHSLTSPKLIGASALGVLGTLTADVTAVWLRQIKPLASLEARRAAGDLTLATHQDGDVPEGRWHRAGDTLPPTGPDEVLVLDSRVLVAGPDGTGWLTVLDFSASPSATAQAELVRELLALRWQGLLLHTGASYHFIGAEVTSFSAWRQRMAQALLLPGIDHRYMGHSLLRCAGGARLTTCPQKPTMPRVIATIGWQCDGARCSVIGAA